MTPCEETMVSVAELGHTHTCDGGHDEDGNHHCPSCGRWWWRPSKGGGQVTRR